MSIDVGTGPQPAEPVEEAPATPLVNLRDLYNKRKSTLYHDLEVPHWHKATGFRVFVRYGLPDVTALGNLMDAEQKKENPDPVRVNAGILISSCLGIYMEMPDGAKVGLTSGGDPAAAWPTFASPALTEAFGTLPTAEASLEALYGVDEKGTVNGAAINTAAQDLTAWAATANQGVDEAFLTP